MFGLDQTAICTLAIFECLEKGGFACTRRHFPKRVRFVTAIVFLNWKHQPGIAPKKRIWLQRGAYLFLKSELDLAGDGFCGRWSERGCTQFDSFFQKWTFHAHETTDFESKKSLEMQGVRKCVFRVDETPLFGKQKLQVREFSHNWGPKLQGLWRRLGRYSPERFF